MEFVDITALLQQILSDQAAEIGILTVYNPHTTAGLTINEGADPAVQADIISALQEIVPRNYPYQHLEGNSVSHIMASLMGSTVTLFVEQNSLQLGTWQRVFFCEFDGPRNRKVFWKAS